MPTMGTVVVEVQWDGQRHYVEFQVVLGESDTVIGYTTAIVFGLVTVTRPLRQEWGESKVREERTGDRKAGEYAPEWRKDPESKSGKRGASGPMRQPRETLPQVKRENCGARGCRCEQGEPWILIRVRESYRVSGHQCQPREECPKARGAQDTVWGKDRRG